MDGLKMSIHRFFHDKSAYTLFEILVVLLLISIVSGGFSSIFSTKQTDYEILAEAHNIKSTIRLLQAKAMQYFEQKLYANTEMRDDYLWGFQIFRGNTLRLVSKSYHSNRVEPFDLKGPVWTDSNIYASQKKLLR
jgi:prepilin-type N-terminal cleavage/methylation domain-containing protein